MADNAIVATIEKQRWLDRVAEPLHKPLHAALSRVPALRDFLDGTWLGHPVHAAISDVPIGLWMSGQVLDVVALVSARRPTSMQRLVGRAGVLGLVRRSGTQRAADRLHALGLASAFAVAAFGLADWTWTRGRTRRLGLAHGLTNLAITGLYAGSLLARARRRRGVGVALSTAGFGALLFSAWLGGELVYKHGVGVSRAAFQGKGPRGWSDAGPAGILREGELRRVEAEGMPILLARHRGELRAIGDTCTHQGCSLSEGKLVGDRVVCDCHGSEFRITDGKVLRGPATVSEPAFDVRVREGRLEIRSAELRAGNGAAGRPSFG